MSICTLELSIRKRRRPVKRILVPAHSGHAQGCWDWGMKHGDIVLYRKDNTLLDLMIAEVTRSIWIHAGMLAWNDEARRWEILDVQQWRGGQCTPLAEAVRRNPGHWDHFAVDWEGRWPEYNRELAVARMREFVGRPYGWVALARDGLSHVPVLGHWAADFKEGTKRGRRPFCSMATTIAQATAGIEIVHHLPHALTEPVHVAQTVVHTYRGTFYPASEEKARA
jgi:hypothetical protein